jgi:glycerol kinase
MLMDLKTLQWDGKMLSTFGIPERCLPQIKPSSDPDGYGLAYNKGPFAAEIPVMGNLGDQQAALFGQTCFKEGDAKNTYGTGCFLLLNTGNTPIFSKNGLITTVGYKIGKAPAVYALEGSIAVAGALVQWFRDKLGIITSAPAINDLAMKVEDNGGVYFVPAFSGLFAPYWRSDARGLIIGLTHFTGKEHIARAVLEAVAFQAREIFEAMEKDSKIKLSSLKVDGGMTASELLMQFQADILNVTVARPKVAETTALGAAYAAGLAAGFWKTQEELKKNWILSKEWKPKMDADKREKYFKDWKKAVERSMGWTE